MNDRFWGRNSNLSPQAPWAMHTCHLCCVVSAMTLHVKMWRAAGVSVYTPRRLPRNSLSGKRVQDEDRQEFQLLFDSIIVLLPLSWRGRILDSATSFPVSSTGRSSILFGHRFNNHILQVLRIVGFFAVLIVVQDEWVYFLLRSLSHVHHAVFSFLVLLQRNPVVDSLVLEHLFFIQRGYPIFLVSSSFLPRCNIRVVQRKFVTLKNLLFSPPNFWQRLAVFVVLVSSFQNCFVPTNARVGELSATSPWLCGTFVAVRNLHVLHHGEGSFWWRDLELIRRRSYSCPTLWYFSKVFRHLPHEQYTMPTPQFKLQPGHCFLEEVS